MSRFIYFFCPEPTRPFGGVRKIYRHVDILNQHGVAARVLHAHRGYRCNWFEHATEISYIDDVRESDISCLVIPEIAGPMLHRRLRLRPPLHPRLPWLGARYWDVSGVPKVIFNQNAYLTFSGYDAAAPERPSPYLDPSVKAVITVSSDSEQRLRQLFPQVNIFRVHNSIDPERFTVRKKERVIAYMPRKAEAFAKLLHERLSANLHGFSIDVIANLSEADVAARLGAAMLYVSLTQEEGFGLSAAEAMASGCLVIGFPAGGGAEFFDPSYCLPVRDGDMAALCETVQMALARAATEPQWVIDMGRKAAAAIRARYSPKIEEEDVMRIWNEVLPRLDSART